jgi:hypothetical protein
MGGVEICEIDCGHFEMLREPYVNVVSQKLSDKLQAIMMRNAGLGAPSAIMKNPAAPSESGAWAGSAA